MIGALALALDSCVQKTLIPEFHLCPGTGGPVPVGVTYHPQGFALLQLLLPPGSLSVGESPSTPIRLLR